MMKFSVNEKVIITATNSIGIVLQTEHKITRVGTMVDETKKYYISQEGFYYSKWFHEHELEATYELADGMLEHINKLLIDVNLKEGKFDTVKILANELYGKCSNE